MISFGKNGCKCSLEYKDDKIEPLCIMLPNMNENTIYLDETKYISFLVEDNKLLKAYNVWNRNEWIY